MLATDATFHLLMSALNVGLLANNSYMLVTAAVLQSAIGPYVMMSPTIDLLTASLMLAFVMQPEGQSA